MIQSSKNNSSASDTDALLKPFSAAIENTQAEISAWKAQGKKVTGYLSNNVPLEILHAADVLPLHLSGNPELPPKAAEEFMEPAFDPITRSVFDRLLRGQYQELDFITLPRSNDAQQRLYYYLCELRRTYPEIKLPEVALVDLLHTLRPSTARHNLRRLQQFQTFLEEQSGQPISDEKLRAAIDTYNKTRKLLSQFTMERARLPLTINSELAFTVYQALRCMPIETFNALLERLLELCAGSKAEQGKRVILAGNGLDYSALHKLFDQLGVSVVGDYHAYGNHFLSGEVVIETTPLEAISLHYQRDTLACRSVNIDPLELLEFTRSQQADGVIFYFLKGEEAWTWHMPKQKAELAKAGIPSVEFSDQAYGLDQQAVGGKIKQMIAALS